MARLRQPSLELVKLQVIYESLPIFKVMSRHWHAYNQAAHAPMFYKARAKARQTPEFLAYDERYMLELDQQKKVDLAKERAEYKIAWRDRARAFKKTAEYRKIKAQWDALILEGQQE